MTPRKVHRFEAKPDPAGPRPTQKPLQLLSAIVSSSDDAIVSKNLQGIVTSWNAAAERIFGYSAEEMIGQPILKIIPRHLHPDEDRILSTIARGERIDHFETVRLRKDGETIEVSLTISPVKDEKGRIIGAAKIARDITQQKKAERSLRTAERLASVGRLAATVAHEINNPLEALTNLLYLARTAPDQATAQKYLRAAEEELHRVALITRQTLGFYRETRDASTTKLGEVTMDLLPVFSSRMRNKGVELRPEIKDDPEIHAVPGEIRQLIANLITNSIDAVGQDGRIRVRVAPGCDRHGSPRPGVRLTVSDNGSGIPREVRKHIFTPFFTTKKDIGTGLGLWVCKTIVDKHKGSIRMRTCTQGPHRGTVFSVFLPARRRNAEPLPLPRAG